MLKWGILLGVAAGLQEPVLMVVAWTGLHLRMLAPLIRLYRKEIAC